MGWRVACLAWSARSKMEAFRVKVEVEVESMMNACIYVMNEK
jgi:hypothetical protein